MLCIKLLPFTKCVVSMVILSGKAGDVDNWRMAATSEYVMPFTKTIARFFLGWLPMYIACTSL